MNHLRHSIAAGDLSAMIDHNSAVSRRRRLLLGSGTALVALSPLSAFAQTSTTATGFDPTQIIAGFTVNTQSMLTLVADATPYALAVVGLVAGFRFLWGTLRKA